MQNVTQLRQKGFTVRQASDAVGCTEVVSQKLFYFYNPRFASTPDEVYDRLEPAAEVEGGYRLLLAGDCPADDDNIPYAIVDAGLRHLAATRYGVKEDAKKAAETAEASFFEAMRNIMHS